MKAIRYFQFQLTKLLSGLGACLDSTFLHSCLSAPKLFFIAHKSWSAIARTEERRNGGTEERTGEKN